VGNISKQLRGRVCERDDWRCWYCGLNLRAFVGVLNHRRSIHVDHVKPRSEGGLTIARNLVTACLMCNLQKRDHALEHFRRSRLRFISYLVRKFEANLPASPPAEYMECVACELVVQGLGGEVRAGHYRFIFYGEYVRRMARNDKAEKGAKTPARTSFRGSLAA